MKQSDMMNLVYSLQSFKDLLNSSKGQSVILKCLEDYFRMLSIFSEKVNIECHIAELLNKDKEFIKIFEDLLFIVSSLKKA